jgi:hypothetical protein
LGVKFGGGNEAKFKGANGAASGAVGDKAFRAGLNFGIERFINASSKFLCIRSSTLLFLIWSGGRPGSE